MKKIIFLFAMLSVCLANAQWVSDTAVNLAVSNTTTTDSQSIGTTTGGTYTVYFKSVPSPVNFEIWVQYLDVNGTKIFGDNGMLVTNTLPMSTYTVIWKLAVDNKNNLYISATGTGNGTQAYVYKITPAGEMPWGAGLNIGAGYIPTVQPMSNYDVLVSWLPASGGKAKINRYNEVGAPVWTSPIEVSSNATYATNSTVVADMYEQSNGYFTAVFHTRLGNGVNSYLFAQRYDSAGTAQWTQPTQLADKGAFYNNLSYTGALDGDVLYYGYSLANGTRYDAYAQRINTDGTLPWGLNGIDFDTNMTSYEINAKLAYSTGSPYVWMIADYTPSNQASHGEYVQKFDKVTGARQFTDNAHQVYAVSSNNTHTGNLFLVNDLPLFAIKTGFDNGATPVTLSAQFLDANGNFMPATYVKPLGTFSASKGRISMVKPVNNQGVITFIEEKTAGTSKIYAQNFSTILDGCTINVNPVASFTKACSVDFADLTVPTANDTCGQTVTATTDQSIFPVTASTTITWTFTTSLGASTTTTQNIVVTNEMAPAAIADFTSSCSVALSDLTAPVVADSCGNNVTATTNGSVFPITQNATITWTFTSVSGTTATQTQNIIINSVLTPPTTLEDVTSACSVTLADLTVPVVTNDCGNTVTPTTDAVFPLTQGTNIITWTYAFGDTTATVTQNVIVNDTTAPTLVVNTITVEVNEDQNVILSANAFNNGSNDPCSGTDTTGWTWSVTPSIFSCADLGEQTVTVSVTDENGNTSEATTTVTITDPNNYCGTTGNEDFDAQNTKVYPNPTQDMFTINSPAALKSVIVYDMLGKMVYKTNASESNITISSQSWASGVYNISIETAEGGQKRMKLVKN